MSMFGINKNQSKGFSLVAVIFIITALALAVVFLQRITNVSVATNNLAMQGARAWQAVEAGSEWGVYQVTQGSCAPSTNFTLTEQSLSGFEVTVGCTTSDHDEEGVTVTLYFLEIFAESGTLGTSPDYVSRKVSLIVEG